MTKDDFLKSIIKEASMSKDDFLKSIIKEVSMSKDAIENKTRTEADNIHLLMKKPGFTFSNICKHCVFFIIWGIDAADGYNGDCRTCYGLKKYGDSIDEEKTRNNQRVPLEAYFPNHDAIYSISSVNEYSRRMKSQIYRTNEEDK